MSDKLIAIVLVLIAIVFYGLGEYSSKLWTIKPSWWLAIVVTIPYTISVFLWLPALLKHGQLAALNTAYDCLAIIMGTLIGVCVFGEVLATRQIIGIILALIACIMVL